MPRCIAATCTLLALSFPAAADTFSQEGTIIGSFGPVSQTEIILAQFDTLGGTRHLNFVQLDFFASLNGSYTGTGSGEPVDVFAVMGASYYLGDTELTFTLALFDDDLEDDFVGPGTLPLSDEVHLTLDQSADLALWIGPGSITLTAFSQLDFSTLPEDQIFFSATGSAQYSITYDFSLVPAPSAPAFFSSVLIARTTRRRRTPR
ncbi:MAG TPA: hypothetical protein VG711_05360 [Phycisphaerales bacterium]|nr:hypothetical protein [Phycisphaerales bacterium]